MGVYNRSVLYFFWVTIATLIMCVLFITLYSGFRHEEKKLQVLVFTILLVLLIRYLIYDVITFFILAGDTALFPRFQRNFQEQTAPPYPRVQFLKLKLRALKSILLINEKHRNEPLNSAYRQIARDVWLYGKYYTILFLLVLVTRDQLLYYNTKFVRHKLYINETTSYGVSELQDFTEFKQYIQVTLINTLNVPLKSGSHGWSLGEQHKVLGVVRLRQLRLQKLHNGLSSPKYDMENYMPHWEVPFLDLHYTDLYWRIYDPWMIEDMSSNIWAAILLFPDETCTVNKYPNLYGYMTTLSTVRKNSEKVLDFLANYQWVTKYTAVVFVDLSMYNADANIFSVITIHIEQTPFGSLYTSANVDSVRLIQNFINVNYVALIILILYILVLVQFTNALVVKLWFDPHPLSDTWNRVDLFICLLNLAIWIVIVLREWMVMKMLRQIEGSTKMEYIDFRVPATMTNLLAILIGFLICVTTIRLWKVMQFGRVFQLFTRTLSLAWKALTSSLLIIAICLIAISIALSLINGSQSNSFNRVGKAVVVCFCFAFGYSNEIEPESLFFGGVLLGLIGYAILTLVVAILLINAFVSLINEYFTEARSRVARQTGSITFSQFLRIEYNDYFFYKNFNCCRKSYRHNNRTVTENINLELEKQQIRNKEQKRRLIMTHKYKDELEKKPETETEKQTNYRMRLERVQGVGDILTCQLEMLHEFLYPNEEIKLKTQHFNIRSRSVI